MTLDESILKTGANICTCHKLNPELIKQGSMIVGLVLVYWVLKPEIGSISKCEDKVRYWNRAKELRPSATKSQLIDTAVALWIYEKVTGENL